MKPENVCKHTASCNIRKFRFARILETFKAFKELCSVVMQAAAIDIGPLSIIFPPLCV